MEVTNQRDGEALLLLFFLGLYRVYLSLSLSLAHRYTKRDERIIIRKEKRRRRNRRNNNKKVIQQF